MVSATWPTRRSAFTFAVNPAVSSTPSRLIVEKPCSAKLTVYTPGLRSTIRYCPASSVVTVLTFSMSAVLLASTVTPGRTPPVESRTTPAIAPDCCAAAPAGTNNHTANTRLRVIRPVMEPSSIASGVLADSHPVLPRRHEDTKNPSQSSCVRGPKCRQPRFCEETRRIIVGASGGVSTLTSPGVRLLIPGAGARSKKRDQEAAPVHSRHSFAFALLASLLLSVPASVLVQQGDEDGRMRPGKDWPLVGGDWSSARH